MAGLRLSFKSSGLDRKIWQSTHLWLLSARHGWRSIRSGRRHQFLNVRVCSRKISRQRKSNRM